MAPFAGIAPLACGTPFAGAGAGFPFASTGLCAGLAWAANLAAWAFMSIFWGSGLEAGLPSGFFASSGFLPTILRTGFKSGFFNFAGGTGDLPALAGGGATFFTGKRDG